MRDLTVVIPNFNGVRLLGRNLPSVIAAADSYPGSVAIIVIDDGSIDNSVAMLRADFPSVRVICHDVNRGFAEAMLTGVIAANTELLFFLNSDVELHAQCLEKLEPYFDDEGTFSVTPLMFDDDGAINRHSWNLRHFRRGYLKLKPWDLSTARKLAESRKLKSLYASGGAMMVTKSKFLELGGFHPIFKPFYGEDFDLGVRAWGRGWPTYFEPNATVLHQSQGAIKDSVARSKVKEIRRRNRYFIEWLHMSPKRLLLNNIPATIAQLLGELISFDRTNLKGFIAAARNIRAALAARHEIQQGQKMSLEEIVEAILESSQ